MFCPKCGTDVAEGAKFCESCGSNIQQGEQNNQNQLEEHPEQDPSGFKPVQNDQQAYQTQPPVRQPQTQSSVHSPQPQTTAYQSRPQPAPAPQNNTYNNENPNEKPYGIGGWLLTFLLMAIPIVNIVMPFVWAFGSGTNKSKQNFFRAYLIVMVIVIVLTIVLYATVIAPFIGMLDDALQQMGSGMF